MLICLGGSLLSWGGEVAGDAPEDPQDDDPELEEDMELVLWRLFGIPWLSLFFTVCRPWNVESPMVSCGLLFLLLFFRLLFCFSLSLPLLGPSKGWIITTETILHSLIPELLDGCGGVQLRSFLSCPEPHLQAQASITRLYPCGFHKFCSFCLSVQFLTFFSRVLFSWLMIKCCQASKQSWCMNLLWPQPELLQINFTQLDASNMCSPWQPLKHWKS